jgi:hypothetical protein
MNSQSDPKSRIEQQESSASQGWRSWMPENHSQCLASAYQQPTMRIASEEGRFRAEILPIRREKLALHSAASEHEGMKVKVKL